MSGMSDTPRIDPAGGGSERFGRVMPWVAGGLIVGAFLYSSWKQFRPEPHPQPPGVGQSPAARGDELVKCPLCGGHGGHIVDRVDVWPDGQPKVKSTCPWCQGAGRLTRAECERRVPESGLPLSTLDRLIPDDGPRRGPESGTSTPTPERPPGTTKQSCPDCRGRGWNDRQCYRCGGEGRTYEASSTQKVSCSNCSGTGRKADPCTHCGGAGHVWK